MDKLAVNQKRDCWICFGNENNTTLTIGDSEKVLKNCESYLDTSIIIKSFENEAAVSCCRYCYESVHQLLLLEEQVEKLQKEISDLSFVFSKNVLERRNGCHTANANESKDESANETEKCLLIQKNSDDHTTTVMFENVYTKKEVIESESRELLSDTEMQTETGQCNIFIDVETADSAIPIIAANQRMPATNTICHRQTTKTSMEAGLIYLKTPIIQLERLQLRPCRNQKRDIVSCDVEENIKCEQASLDDSIEANNYSEKNSTALPFKCREISCSKAFKSRTDFLKHQKIHSGERPHQCPVCLKSFRQSGHLITHKKSHSGERPYKCSFCTKSFKMLSHLKDHERIHSGERPFKCHEISCLKYFATKNVLIRHQKIHSGEKSFKCSFCSKLFRQTSHLKQHERTHSGEKPYKCRFCSKLFRFESNSKKHETIHTGVKPYNCSNCEKTFKTKQILTRHSRRTHGEYKEEFILS